MKAWLSASVLLLTTACGTTPDKFQAQSGERPVDFMRRMTIETSSGVDQAIRSANLPSEKDGIRRISGTFLPFGTAGNPNGVEIIANRLRSYCRDTGGEPLTGSFTQKLATTAIGTLLADNQFKGGKGTMIWCKSAEKIFFSAQLGNDNGYAPAISYYLKEPTTEIGQAMLATELGKAREVGAESARESERKKSEYEAKMAAVQFEREKSRAALATAKIGEKICSQPYAYSAAYVGYIEDMSEEKLKVRMIGSASGIMREFKPQEIHWVDSSEWRRCN